MKIKVKYIKSEETLEQCDGRFFTNVQKEEIRKA